jgi:Zn-dependent metalloprotease
MNIFLIFLIFLNLNAKSFKEERTIKISPLSDSIIKIEKEKRKRLSPSTIKTSSINQTEELFKNFNKSNSKRQNWKAKYDFDGFPYLIEGDRTKRYYGDIEEISRSFIIENSKLLGVDITSLKLEKKSEIFGTKHIEYKQYYKDIPVEFSYVRIHSDETGEITQYNAKYFRNINLDITPSITIEQAKNVINSELFSANISTWSFVIFPDILNDRYFLAYKIKTNGDYGALNGKWVYYIDAKSGNILLRYDERQYSCNLSEETTGFVKGEVYEISPLPTGQDQGQSYWVPKIIAPIANQYVFAGDQNHSTTTKNTGEYCIDYDNGNVGAKIFMTLMGPYFSVMNFNGQPSFYTNTTYRWGQSTTPLSVNSYPTNSEITYTISPSYSLSSNESLAFVGPLFYNFNIGKVDNCGSGIDNDMVYVIDSNGNTISAFFGQNKTNLFGGLVPTSQYKIKIKSDPANSGSFNIITSTYLVIQNYQGANNATGSITWSTNNYLTDGNGASINAFYHLNRIRDFMMKFNSKCGGSGCINLDKRVPVMVQVSGDGPDEPNENCFESNTMWNAFYDLEHDALFFGKGVCLNYEYCKDFALDGTVIRHEYGHLVMNRIYPIIYFGEFGAISEAIADYFSLSSFWDEGKDITVLGNFVGIGEGAARDLSSFTNKMPDDWVGEVHDDSKILSGVFYKLRKGTYNLGYFSSGPYSGLHKADVYIFGSLFYFPDNFENFMYAMIDLCKKIEGSNCETSKITQAFGAHGIPVSSTTPIFDPYEPNNGPEYATDISSFNTIIAYIDYQGDEDYYVIPLKEGIFHARLNLPYNYANYKYFAYDLLFFDSKRNYIKDVQPQIHHQSCETDNTTCYTFNPYIDLYVTIDKPGLYYLSVVGHTNQNYNNGVTFSTIPYILTYDIDTNKQIINAEVTYRKTNEDEITFTAAIPKFEYINSLPPTSWQNGQEFEFCGKDCIRILDHNLKELPTSQINNYITVEPVDNPASYYTIDSLGRNIIKGKLKFTSYNGKTISDQFPYLGTIYLKVYLKNHMFNVGKSDNYISLGISNPINLTAEKDLFTTYDNVIKGNPDKKITIKYETTTQTNVKITVYTATGQKIKTIYEGPIYGKNTFVWDQTDDKGSKVKSGIYYIKTEGAVNKIEKVAIVR